MAEKDKLKHLKVALLQVICKGLNLSIPHPPVRRKAPYLGLLKDAISFFQILSDYSTEIFALLACQLEGII